MLDSLCRLSDTSNIKTTGAEMTNALNRVARQLRAAQDASDKPNAFLEKRADAGHFIRQIAKDLSEALALAEASMLAARPSLTDHITIDSSEIMITGQVRIEGNASPIHINLERWK
jgi:DNA topoisomerase VI subunit B